MTNERTDHIVRPYSASDVRKLAGSVTIEHTLARLGAEKLRQELSSDQTIRALGAVTGNQAVQMVRAGLRGLYVSGWQVAADANVVGETYPDQSLYPVNSVPTLVKRINNSLVRADQIEHAETGSASRDWLVPVVADAEAGFGGPLNAYELMKAMIEAGAAGVHFEDQLASEKKCGHLGGKVLVPTSQFIRTLVAARLAADVCNVPTVIIARTDAESATLITSDADERDHDFIDALVPRTHEGYHRLCRHPIERCIARGLSYAPYADALWMETSTPNLDVAREFASEMHSKFPGKWLFYNCSPSFKWSKFMDKREQAEFQDKLAEMGYVFQFVTLAGFHSLNYGMFELASAYRERGMQGYVDLQDVELSAQERGYTAVTHQREVGTGYFDTVMKTIDTSSSTQALESSTEKQQF